MLVRVKSKQKKSGLDGSAGGAIHHFLWIVAKGHGCPRQYLGSLQLRFRDDGEGGLGGRGSIGYAKVYYKLKKLYIS